MAESESFELTKGIGEEKISADTPTEIVVVEWIGRYHVERVLGKGSFGLVYLAYDERLDRHVAVKVPHLHLITSQKDAELYLREARMVAGLDHPSIVPVHDVGHTAHFPCFVVSKYIAGGDLAGKRELYSGRYVEIAELMAIAAEALHYAHTKGVVHRDVKPSNILIDDYHKPFLVDFGLAIKEEELGKGPRYVGTPAYMSPEQALGEGHRVDGRTDVYSLGAVMYELMSRRRPFSGNSKEDMLRQITTREPKPPRQIEDGIPRELERICLRALARRAAERYTTALDMAEELWRFVAQAAESHLNLAPPLDRDQSDLPSTIVAGSRSTPSGSHARLPMLIVPKGLRSFDEHDADFFLELLPGPRDRNGMPPSIRFWKNRIEEFDADKTFCVGLIYGPSGCGKSSLVKAGLLPHLSGDVEAIYIESTPDQTEARTLLRLRKRFAFLPAQLSLKESLAYLRRSDALGRNRKVLIVLDQFEQWLHAHRAEADAELVQALRQCDGSHVQCILMVRDDFWMAATRFMHELEVQLVEDENLSAVDLFPDRHARQVLAAFGRAFGALSAESEKLNKAHEEFLNRAIEGLSEDGKVVCVRLALFAEMLKDKPWTVATLDQVGGTKGVGVRFLEETFRSASASPEHRYHEAAARAVLDALLPDVGSDIKGRMRSYGQLLEASGYANRRKDFEGLIKILDSEIRLITPTEPAAAEGESADEKHEPQDQYFQLTHDYLVPSLRDWLTRKKQETRKGRAELTLADRSNSWNAKPERRQLPSLLDYVRIVALTSRKEWTPAQRRMMGVADKVYGVRTALTAVLALLFVGTAMTITREVRQAQNRNRVSGLVDQLLVAEVAELPAIAEQLEDESTFGRPLLEMIAEDSSRHRAERLRAQYVLANQPGSHVQQLIDGALNADQPFLAKISDRLAAHAAQVTQRLWPVVSDKSTEPQPRLRAAVLLAASDPYSSRWDDVAPAVISALIAEDPLYLDEWIEMLRPTARTFLPYWKERFLNDSAFSSAQATASRVLGHYADAELMCELLLVVEPGKWSTLSIGLSRHADAVAARLQAMVQAVDAQRMIPQADLTKLRNAIVTLLRLGHVDDVAALLSTPADPTLRTMVILQLRDFKLDPALLLDARQASHDAAVRQALLLALERYMHGDLPQPLSERLSKLLKELAQHAESGAEQIAAQWALRKSGNQSDVAHITDQLTSLTRPARTSTWMNEHDWWVNSVGQTMLVIGAPQNFVVGQSEGSKISPTGQKLSSKTLTQSVAVSAYEVSMPQYKLFRPGASFAMDIVADELSPANRISVVDAMGYCRWLSEREHVPLDQMCYPPVDEITIDDVYLSAESRAKSGYRLLTEAEWECMCRAGSETIWPCDQDGSNLASFAWFMPQSHNQLHAVGSLLPNAWGVHDAIGNAAEWCQPSDESGKYPVRGGHYQNPAPGPSTSWVYMQSNTGYSYNGFRIACTLKESTSD